VKNVSLIIGILLIMEFVNQLVNLEKHVLRGVHVLLLLAVLMLIARNLRNVNLVMAGAVV
jgi:hypothetical protein